MRNRIAVWGPDELDALQNIFDLVWRELQQQGIVRPGGKVTRNLVSERVFANAQGDALDVERITRSVLSSFGSAA